MNPFLCLPPEAAHKIVIKLLRCGLVPQAPADNPALSRAVLGQVFSNPAGISAGADKDAVALAGWERLGFGFIEVGSVMPRPRSGNPAPRIWRFRDQRAVVNWMGLPSPGPEPILKNIQAFRKSQTGSMKIGVSIASVEGHLEDFRRLSGMFAPVADYMTLNVSCPNTEEGAADAARSMKAQAQAVVEAAGACPVLLKMGPTRDAGILRAMVESALEAGVKGFVACNTAPFDKKDLLAHADFGWPQRDGQPVGGYSGPELLPISTWMVSEIRKVAGPDVVIIGVGGIQSGDDAKAMMRAGADLVQLYTGFIYRGPGLVREIKAALV